MRGRIFLNCETPHGCFSKKQGYVRLFSRMVPACCPANREPYFTIWHEANSLPWTHACVHMVWAARKTNHVWATGSQTTTESWWLNSAVGVWYVTFKRRLVFWMWRFNLRVECQTTLPIICIILITFDYNVIVFIVMFEAVVCIHINKIPNAAMVQTRQNTITHRFWIRYNHCNACILYTPLNAFHNGYSTLCKYISADRLWGMI